MIFFFAVVKVLQIVERQLKMETNEEFPMEFILNNVNLPLTRLNFAEDFIDLQMSKSFILRTIELLSMVLLKLEVKNV